MPTRRENKIYRQKEMAESRRVNGHLKRAERARRDARMKDLVAKGKYPYTPVIMSWLSEKIGKPSRLLTQDEIKAAVGA